MTERSGSCLCGAVTYTVRGEPLAARTCWCRDCQRIASNGTANGIFPTASIEVTGKVAAHQRTAASGNMVTRRFCPACGAHLFSDSTGRPGLTVIRIGTLDDPSSVRPDANIWTASAPSWACLDPALDDSPGQPAPPPSPSPP